MEHLETHMSEMFQGTITQCQRLFGNSVSGCLATNHSALPLLGELPGGGVLLTALEIGAAYVNTH
eukprot:1144356-Pelagomonas_calceolata.AAC.1